MTYELIAAVDLGSNSFRLQVGRVVDEQIYPLDALKEPVRLASGLDKDEYLDEPAQTRAIEALRRFGERLRGFSPEAVRAVATNTMRVARNAGDFLDAAAEALGFPIEIIGGREEARLIYNGVAHSLPMATHKRFVVDIGGGSTEFIIGRKLEPILLESLFMGCVGFSLNFFPAGQTDKKNFRAAETAAAAELQSIKHDYRRLGWKEAVGSSGSARAMAEILMANDLNPPGANGITREGLEKLKNMLIKAGSTEALQLIGLRPDRQPVFAGAMAIMCAIFSTFDLTRMTYASGALRLGVLYDLLGRFQHHDMRDATIVAFMRRYQIEHEQAERVETMAVHFFDQLAPEARKSPRRQFLVWAARMHEIGISIAHTSYHKHSAYILAHADMPGFSKQDQMRLAQLVLIHRGKLDNRLEKVLPGLALPEQMDWLPVIALRLAVLLSRSRSDTSPVLHTLSARERAFSLCVPAGWLDENPLTAASLAEEAHAWSRQGISFTVESTLPEAA